MRAAAVAGDVDRTPGDEAAGAAMKATPHRLYRDDLDEEKNKFEYTQKNKLYRKIKKTHLRD